MKYIITIEKIDNQSTDKYPPKEIVYQQVVLEDITEEVVCAVNNLKSE